MSKWLDTNKWHHLFFENSESPIIFKKLSYLESIQQPQNSCLPTSVSMKKRIASKKYLHLIYFNFPFNLNFKQDLVCLINMVHVGDNGNHCHNIQVGDQDNIHHLIQERNEFPQDSKVLYAISVFHSSAFLPFLEHFHFQEVSKDHVFWIEW